MANEPLKGMSMERVRVEEFENQRYKIVDESILLFFGVSLWKLFTFCGYKNIYSRVYEECEKSFFYKTGGSSDSLATGTSHEFQSRNN